ncbi:hypothetical protein BKI52_06000 [marine bacterium AO1-C]|nr:hypothetical protein BKI52_06000 [marine bacterium AO1-C]
MQTPLAKRNSDTNRFKHTNEVDYNELLGDYLKKIQWRETQSIQECMSQLLSELVPFLGGVKATLYLAYNDSQTLKYLTGYGIDEKNTPSELKYGEDMVGQVAKTQKGIYQHYTNQAQLFTATISVSIRGVMVVPIVANHELVGVLEIALIKKINEQKYKFLQQLTQHIGFNLKIRRQEQALKLKNLELEKKNANITSSIRYAHTIQQAILPTKAFLDKIFAEHFVIYQPKDIVSGDFYWVGDVSVNIKDKLKIKKRLVIAVMDCTGHGVPGSMMSMVGNTLLNQIVKEQHNHDAKSIMLALHHKIREALRQEESDNQDGMDGGICVVDYLSNGTIEMTYAGAKRALLVARGESGQVRILKGDRTSLGGSFTPETKGVHNHTLTLKKGDVLYLTTDGLEDASCPLRKKYGFKKLADDLRKIMLSPLIHQKQILLQRLQKHQQGTPQRDDITMLAAKL